jgi:ATP-dependent helicase/nuclease subunit A
MSEDGADEPVPVDDLEGDQYVAATAVDPDLDLSLRAAAGSGKTTTLTARYVEILETQIETLLADTTLSERARRKRAETLPRRILVTTFTERAADELAAEIRARGAQRITDAPDAKRRLWRAAVDGLDDAYIGTIHALCRRLLTEYALAADVPVGVETLDESDTARLVQTATNQILETSTDPAIATLAERFDRDTLRAWVSQLVTRRRVDVQDWTSWLDEHDDADDYVGSLLAEVVPPATARTLVERLQDAYESEAAARDVDPAGSVLDAVVTFGDGPEADAWAAASSHYYRVAGPLVERCRDVTLDELDGLDAQLFVVAVADAITTGDGAFYSGDATYLNSGGRRADTPRATRYRAATAAFRATIDPPDHVLSVDPARDRRSFRYLQAFATLGQLAGAEYEQRKRDKGVIDYTDQIQRAKQLLETGAADVVREIRAQFDHVMVDEFQDTNDNQWAVVKQLVAGDDDVDPASVLLVGDEKQSIYRFRGADVTVFDRAESWLAERPDRTYRSLALNLNFRTQPTPLDGLNGLFDAVFVDSPSRAYEATPQAMRAARDDTTSTAVEYLAVPTGDQLRAAMYDAEPRAEPDAGSFEADAVAARIVDLVGDDTSDVTPGDIAVLLRSRTGLDAYERALHRANVPFTVVEGEGFFETPEIRAMLTLLDVVIDPTDDRALHGLLRSPVFGLPDTTLGVLWAIADDHASLWAALEAADADAIRTAVDDAHATRVETDRLTAIRETIERWRGYAGTTSPGTSRTVSGWATFVSRVFTESGVLASVAADERGRRGTANLDRFREKLRGFERDGHGSLSQVRTSLREQAAEDAEQEATVADATDRVTVMTVHNAKGDEFPVVVVPRLGSQWNSQASIGQPRGASLELERVGTDRTPYLGIRGPKPDAPHELGDTFARAVARERRTAETRAEEKRTLYVASTRARDRLVLVGTHHDREKWDARRSVAPDAPRGWGDFVYEPLFEAGDDEAPDPWDALATSGQQTVTLPFTLPPEDGDGDGGAQPTGTGSVTVRLAPDTVRTLDAPEVPTPSVALTPAPDAAAWRIAVSPNQLSRLAAGYGTLEADESTRRVSFREAAIASGSSSNEPSSSAAASSSALAPNVYGQMLHRLCELRMPETDRRAFLDQVADEERAKGEQIHEANIDADADAILAAAQRGIAYIERLHDDLTVQAAHDEFDVELDLDRQRTRLRGSIDHLVVTPDAYYVVDYKTDRYDPAQTETAAEFLADRREHHDPQIRAYAAALQSADPSREVHARLYFTELDPDVDATPPVAKWTPDEFEDARAETAALIGRHLPAEAE